MKEKIILFVIFTTIFLKSYGQSNPQWDSIKAATSPIVAPAFINEYDSPYKQLLSEYGWEDGIHIARNGLHLYALYYPGDLFNWVLFFNDNAENSTFCELFGDSSFIRPYVNYYGMDMITNSFGCDYFLNTDILYANRANVQDSFTNWQLSDIARPGAIEGGAYPLLNKNDPSQIDIFLFTGNSDIWMIRNTSANPNNINTATRLPEPINPNTNEFEADNPHLERLNEDTLILVYEKYTNSDERGFMYTFSYDNGFNWTNPTLMTSINHNMGKIEHPHLYKDKDEDWYMYYSLDCEIYRSKQGSLNDWDDWSSPELVIGKGNASCIGEPSLTNNGDISFAVVYSPNHVNNDSTDTYEIDPWYLPKKRILSTTKTPSKQNNLSIYPNPFEHNIFVASENLITKIYLYNARGGVVIEKEVYNKEVNLNIEFLKRGVYLMKIYSNDLIHTRKITKR